MVRSTESVGCVIDSVDVIGEGGFAVHLAEFFSIVFPSGPV